LTFPGNLVEDGRETASYDLSNGIFNLKIPKETPGEHFKDIDLLTTLLAKSDTKSVSPTSGFGIVEVTSSHSPDGNIEQLEDEEEFNWEVDQQCPDDKEEQKELTGTKYGFNSQYQGYFTHVQGTENEVLELANVESTTLQERRETRMYLEDSKFDEDHYM
jgi:protein SHQ1